MDVRQIDHMVSVQECRDELYLLRVSYPETDAINATGMILRTGRARGGVSSAVLNTNDALVATWCSPEQNLWAVSARGQVYTTAAAGWPPPAWAGLQYDVLDPQFAWRVTSLPDQAQEGGRPILNAIWGSSDEDVFAGTYDGVVYRWDGRSWSQFSSGTGNGINHIAGSGPLDVWAVGEKGLVRHWDGRAWATVPYPGDATGDGLTGVRVIDGKVFICGRSGRVLHGTAGGLEILAELDLALYGIARFDGRIILAAGDDGAFELQGRTASLLKDKFAAVGIFETRTALYFVEPAQDRARVVEYDPANPAPWARRAP